MPRQFDAIVIGAGQAGPSLVGRLTSAGMTVALIERHLFGGTCVNTGCTPTKALIASAEVAHQVRRAAEYGIRVSGAATADLPAIQARKDGVVSNSRQHLEAWIAGMDRCTVFRGHATLESATQVRVGTELLTAPRIFLNVGGRAVVPDLPGVEGISYLTSTSILQLQHLPRHLVVVGGSYIGLEFAQAFRRFGSEVTVVEKGPHLLWREDADICSNIEAIFRNEGIQLRTRAECIRFESRDGQIAVGVDCHEGEPEVVGSHLLLAVGRRPNTDDLGAERAGLALDKHGYIITDEQLRTNVEGIWALGDCNGRGAFTHTAYNDYEIVAQNLLDGRSRRVSERIPCYGLFIDPPLGRVGLSENEARERKMSYRVGTRAMTRVGRAVEKGESQGLMKILVENGTDRILGGAVLGVGGDEAVHSILDMMSAGAGVTRLQDTVHIHPTVAELIPTIAGELQPLAAV